MESRKCFRYLCFKTSKIIKSALAESAATGLQQDSVCHFSVCGLSQQAVFPQPELAEVFKRKAVSSNFPKTKIATNILLIPEAFKKKEYPVLTKFQFNKRLVGITNLPHFNLKNPLHYNKRMILNKKVHNEHSYTVNSWQNYLNGRLQFSNSEMQFLLYRISPQSQKPGTAKAFRCKLSFAGRTQEFNQHSELLSQKAFSSLQIQCHPSLFKYGNCQSFQGKIYTDHVLIHRGLQSLESRAS